MTTNRLTFRQGTNIIVFRYGKTSNKKIADKKENIVQTYTFSEMQFQYVYSCMRKNEKPVFKEFFNLDGSNCGNCPLSANMGYKLGKCYTHKVMQYSGFISMLKSINNEFKGFINIPTYEEIKGHEFFTNRIVNRYVRFGTYGEPSLIPYELIQSICEIAKSWTGYTHQYQNNSEYLNYLMASTHGAISTQYVSDKFNGRSFVAVNDLKSVKAVNCPASAEMNFKSNCSACGLCSGIKGKGNKNVKILTH